MNNTEKILYKEFLIDKKIYNLNSGYWKRKLIKNLKLKFSIDKQYISNRKSNGENFYDGNPIFSYIEDNKAFRIIQEDPAELLEVNSAEVKPIEAWIDNLYLINNTDSTPELVISLYLTKETVEKCIQLIRLFRFEELNQDNIDNLI